MWVRVCLSFALIAAIPGWPQVTIGAGAGPGYTDGSVVQPNAYSTSRKRRQLPDGCWRRGEVELSSRGGDRNNGIQRQCARRRLQAGQRRLIFDQSHDCNRQDHVKAASDLFLYSRLHDLPADQRPQSNQSIPYLRRSVPAHPTRDAQPAGLFPIHIELSRPAGSVCGRRNPCFHGPALCDYSSRGGPNRQCRESRTDLPIQ